MSPAGLFCTNLKKAVDNSPFSWYNNTRRQGRRTSYGGLAQLGERLHGMQEVSGSITLFSTKKTLHSLCGVFLFARLLVQPDAVNRKIKAEDALPGWKGRLLLFLAVLHARRSRLGRGRVKADEIFRIDPVLWFLF